MTKSFTELIKRSTFEERYEYLKLGGSVGEVTFGFDRYLNQRFYRSRQWTLIRDEVLIRDCGCDLSMPNHEVYGKVVIHHMNPITLNDISSGNPHVYDPEFLICVSVDTHLAIHYGNKKLLPKQYVERRPGDTRLWNHW